MISILSDGTYTYIWNANGDWIKYDVEECNESSNPEREDHQNDQPDDKPKSFCHCLPTNDK